MNMLVLQLIVQLAEALPLTHTCGLMAKRQLILLFAQTRLQATVLTLLIIMAAVLVILL